MVLLEWTGRASLLFSSDPINTQFDWDPGSLEMRSIASFFIEVLKSFPLRISGVTGHITLFGWVLVLGLVLSREGGLA